MAGCVVLSTLMLNLPVLILRPIFHAGDVAQGLRRNRLADYLRFPEDNLSGMFLYGLTGYGLGFFSNALGTLMRGQDTNSDILQNVRFIVTSALVSFLIVFQAARIPVPRRNNFVVS
jgi:hypothetical protein